MRRVLIAAALVLVALPSMAPAQDLTPEQARGKALFNGTCAFCHDARGHATVLIAKRVGPGTPALDAREDLSGDYVRYAVRRGVGSMPWFRRTEFTDPDLDAVVAYLTRPRSEAAK